MDYRPFPPSPFASLISPSDIVRALESSESLERLDRRVCRPLDKPLLAKRLPAELARHDQAVDDEPDGTMASEPTAAPAPSPRLTVGAMLSNGALNDIVCSGSAAGPSVDPDPRRRR